MVEQAFSLIKYIDSLNLFKRNKKNKRTKIYAIIDYILFSSYRKSADRISIYFQKISKSSIERYVKAFKEKVKLSREVKHRKLIAMDETVIKTNGKKCYVYAAYDLSNDELICMKAYATRNMATTLDFVRKVLKLCDNKPIFVVDKAPWYRWVFEKLGLSYVHETFGIRNKVERVFGYLKQRSMLFYHNINVNLRSVIKRMEKGLSDKIALNHLNLFLRLFMVYYDWFVRR